MKLKKVVSICLVGAMAATLLTACGSNDETVGEEIKDDAETVVEDVEDVAEEAAEDVKDVAEDVGEGVKDAVEDVGEDVKDAAEEAVEDVKDNANGGSSFEGFEETITVTGFGMNSFGSDGLDEVVEAINEITISEINVQFDYTELDMATYSEQLGLMFAGGESVDLVMIIPSSSTSFAVMQSKNQLMDISDIAYEYAPDAMELLEPYVSAMEVNGALYGLPAYRIYNSDGYLLMRKDILDELGLTEKAENLSSWTEVEEIFAAVYDAQDSLPEDLQTTCVIINPGNMGQIINPDYCNVAADDFSGDFGYDVLGDSYQIICTDDEGNVDCIFLTDDFLTEINRVRQWYENDWVYKDAANGLDNGFQVFSTGGTFAMTAASEVGVEASYSRSTGYEIIAPKICSIPIQTVNGNSWGWGVPVTAAEPEAALVLLNLMYTNADIENLLVYGIEGRDYELNDEGEAVILEDAVYQSSDWMYGNQFLAYPAEGQGSDFREYSHDVMIDGEISPYYGFTIDTDPIDAELSSVYSVMQKYLPGLQSGTIAASETYEDFVNDLYDAGLQTMIDYYQSELDAWLAEQ